MEGIYIKSEEGVKKLTYGIYSFLNARFMLITAPQKMNLVRRIQMNRIMGRKPNMVCGDTFAVRGKHFIPCGDRAISENIDALCRKVCKNRGVRMPPRVAVCDEVFTNASAEAVRGLGRLCTEIYIVTKSAAAHTHAEYMRSEYGCIVRVCEDIPKADIIIAADTVEDGAPAVIDLFGNNVHIKNRICDLSFEYKNINDEERHLFGTRCNSHMYDFLKICGADMRKNVNFIGYR